MAENGSFTPRLTRKTDFWYINHGGNMKRLFFVLTGFLAIAAAAQTYERRDPAKMKPALTLAMPEFRPIYSPHSEALLYQRVALQDYADLLLAEELTELKELGATISADPEKYIADLEELLGPALFPSLEEAVTARIEYEYRTVLSMLMGVRWFAPTDRDSIFDWNGDRASLEHKIVSVVIALDGDPVYETAMRESRSLGTPVRSPDMVTGVRYLPPTKDCVIQAYFFIDRILAAPHAQVASLFALAHELYGNVQEFLEVPCEALVAKPETRDYRIAREIRSFEEGIAYGQRFMTSQYYLRDMDDEFRTAFAAALKEEEAGLASWKAVKK